MNKIHQVRSAAFWLTCIGVFVAAKPTMDFDGRFGATTGSWTTEMFVEAVYTSLKEKK